MSVLLSVCMSVCVSVRVSMRVSSVGEAKVGLGKAAAPQCQPGVDIAGCDE